MSTIEAEIQITRTGNKVIAISFKIPVWTEKSFDGSIKVNIPYICNTVWVDDMQEVSKAVEETMHGDCIIAEKLGKGIEKELEGIGWIVVEKNGTRSILKYNTSNIDRDISRALKKSGNCVEQNLQVA